MKNIVIIPARGGSKRLPNKNILLLDGIPLIAHSIIYAQKNAPLIDAVFVSTDDEKIKEIAIKYGAKVIDRPNELSGDLEPTVSALKHALEHINDSEIENIILLQPTNPLRSKNLLHEAFNVYEENNCDSLFTVSENNQKFGKIVSDKFVPLNYEIGQRSQDLEPLYFENGVLYISKAKVILNNEIITKNAFPYRLNHVFSKVDIDAQEDFDFAEYLLKKQIKRSNKKLAIQNYKRFCEMDGSDFIASEFALETILKIIRIFNIKDILELGLGIGSIADTVLKYAQKENLKINYVGTEKNEFCLSALPKNVLNYNQIVIHEELKQIKNKKFDLIIIDGYDDTLKEIVAYCKSNSIIFIEGDRKGQTEMIRQVFPKSIHVNIITLYKQKPYSHCGGDTNNYIGGGQVFFIDPTFQMKLFWFGQKITTYIKNKIRKYK